ncbi:MAG: MBL fold metallo-hydrolase [Verrucomicrobiota bacterium]
MKSTFRVGDGCLQVRGLAVHFHAIYDDEGVYLIDGGFLGAVSRLESALAGIDRQFSDVRAILLTHGHLDHTFNVAELQRRTKAPVWAPKQDAAHVAGTYPYRGLSRICGTMEKAAGLLLRFDPPAVDHWFEPGDELPFWGGLRVIGLPGHTIGHCGFYSEPRRLLFSADLFSNYWGPARKPPPWFNAHPEMIDESLREAMELDPAGVLPNHSRRQLPEAHLESLKSLAKRRHL